MRSLRLEILFRILARPVLEIQVAQIFIKLILELEQVIQSRLLALAGERIFRPEGINEQRKQQKNSGYQSRSLTHDSKTSVRSGFAANLLESRPLRRIGIR